MLRESAGDATRSSNGIIVALETLRHVEPVKPDDLILSWRPSDDPTDLHRTRAFAMERDGRAEANWTACSVSFDGLKSASSSPYKSARNKGIANGWAPDGAVQDKIDDTVKNAVLRARTMMPAGVIVRNGAPIASSRSQTAGARRCLEHARHLGCEQRPVATGPAALRLYKRIMGCEKCAMPHSFDVDSAMVRELEESLDDGPMLSADGMRLLNEEELARFSGLSVQIYAGEHPPPHFHVRHGGENVSFALDTGRRLAGAKGLARYDRNIAKWWRDHRCELILAWNRLRPADCPVGPVPVPAECITTTNGDGHA